MKLPSLRSKRAKAFALAGAMVTVALPLAATSTPASSAVVLEPTCAGAFSGDVSNPQDVLPAGIIPLTTGYTNASRVTKGQEKIVNDASNPLPSTDPLTKGVRYSASLTLKSSPAYNSLLGMAPGAQDALSSGYLKVSWKNGIVIPVNPAKPLDLANPVGTVEQKTPTLEIGETTKTPPYGPSLPTAKITVAKGTFSSIAPARDPAGANSVGENANSNYADGDIVRTIATGLPITNTGTDEITAGSWNTAYKSTYETDQQSLWAIYPDVALGAAGLANPAQAGFITTMNTLLLAVNPAYIAITGTGPDDNCSTVGLLALACEWDPTLLPAAFAPFCGAWVQQYP